MRTFSLVAGLLVLMSAAEVWAFDIESTRPMALGGASRAQCPSNAALYLNPSGLSLGRMYHVETLYSYVPTANGHVAGASVVDSVTAPLAMGISFNYHYWDSNRDDHDEYDVRLSAAYYIARTLALGVTLKYVYADSQGNGPLGENIFDDNGEDTLNTVTVDVGATLTLRNVFNLAVVGYNLTDTGSTAAPLSLGAGASLQLSSFVVVADVLFDWTSRPEMGIRAMGGAEYFLADHYPLRVGYRYDSGRDSHAIAFGFGYVSARWAIELSMRQDVSAERLHSTLGLTLRYFAN